MSKRFWSSLVLAISLAAPGCRMCCPSYDYCGPTNPGESNSECCGMARRGSIFSTYYGPDAEYVEEGTIVEEGTVIEQEVQPTPVPAPAQVQPAPKSTRTPTPARFSSRRSS